MKPEPRKNSGKHTESTKNDTNTEKQRKNCRESQKVEGKDAEGFRKACSCKESRNFVKC